MRIATQSRLAAECKRHLECIEEAASDIEDELDDAICEDRDPIVRFEILKIEDAVNRIDAILDRECHESPLEWLERTWRP